MNIYIYIYTYIIYIYININICIYILYIYIYTEYSHPKLNCHILLIFHPYNTLLPFFYVIYQFMF